MKELLDEFWLVHIYDTRWLKAYKLSAAVQFAIRKTYFLYQMWDDMSQGVKVTLKVKNVENAIL